MRAPLLLLALVAGCSSDPGVAEPVDTDDADAVVDGCRAAPRPADAPRFVIVSKPYTPDGDPASRWEVLELGADGALATTGRAFTMGRATTGVAASTPDGSLFLAPQEDGTLGVVAVDDVGVPTVVEAGWNGDPAAPFYASEVVVDPSGERAWVIDGNWPEHGGGVHELTLDCATGAPTYVGRVLRTKNATGLHPLGDGRAVVVADAVGKHEDGDVFLLDGWPDDPAVAGGAVLFPEGDALVGGHAVTEDGRFVLVGDHSEFSAAPNAVAWAAIGDDGLTPGGSFELLDPYAIVTGPDAALVASGYGDTFVALDHDPDATPAFRRAGDVFDTGPRPALPGSMVTVRRGPLAGLVLAIENVAVRRLWFRGDGVVEDLGPFGFEGDLNAIPGAIGVQP